MSRRESQVDLILLKRIVAMINALNLYDAFHAKLIESSSLFYKSEFESQLKANSIESYLAIVENAMKQENKRVDDFLLESSREALIHCILETGIKYHFQVIIDRGFFVFCDSTLVNELQLMYSLFELANGIEFIKEAFRKHIKEKSREIMSKEDDLIINLLHFRSKIDILNMYFKDSFSVMIKETFEETINEKGSKPAELLAKFMDDKLKRIEDEIEGSSF